MSLSPAELAQRLVAQAQRALQRHRDGDLAGAEADYRAVIDRVEHIGLYSGFGTLLLQTGRAAEAARWLRRAAVLAPARDEVIERLGVLARECGAIAAAEVWLRRRVALSPPTASVLGNLGVALTAAHRFDEAVDALRAACRMEPDSADHRFNLAVALRQRGDWPGALAAHRQGLCLRPAAPGSTGDAALCATWCGRGMEALALYRRLIRLRPDDRVGRFWRGNMALLAGDWREGWADFELRRRIPGLAADANRNAHLPSWTGAPMPDGVLAVIGEQGIGDVLLFCRFLPLVAARVGRIILQVHAPLVPLLSGQFPGVTVEPLGHSVRADAEAPLLSLPDRLGITPATLPRAPCLTPPADRVAIWRERLGLPEDAAGNGPRLFGLVWAGNPGFLYDSIRSPGLAAVRRLLDTPGWRPVILQVGAGRQGLDHAALPPGTLDLGDRLRDFADTAAVVALLDRLVTSDTAVAHLGGALGRDTWLMAPCHADWRWATAPDGSTLWHPTVRQFRQHAPGRWDAVVDDIHHALAADILPAQ